MTPIVKIMHTLNSQIKLYYCTYLHIKKPYRMTSSLMKTGDWKIGNTHCCLHAHQAAVCADALCSCCLWLTGISNKLSTTLVVQHTVRSRPSHYFMWR